MNKGRPYYKDLDAAFQQSTTSTQQFTAPNGSDGPILPANDRRLAVIFGINVNTDVYLWPQLPASINGVGLPLRGAASANPQLVLSLRLHGDMVRAPWFARGIATSVLVTVVEVLGPPFDSQ